MIQFNLLPDIKIEFLRAQRMKRLVTAAAILAGGVSLFLLLFMAFTVYGFQKKNINDLTRDITSQSKNLTDTADLNKILTIQNQLGALDGLHDNKVVTTRLFPYMQQVTPNSVSLTQLNVDYAANTMQIQGKANDLAAVNTFIDSLKFTKYRTESAPDDKLPAFSNVVLSQFTRSGVITYTIDLSFDPVIFASQDNATLETPNMITTRSQTERPEAIFSQPVTGNSED